MRFSPLDIPVVQRRLAAYKAIGRRTMRRLTGPGLFLVFAYGLSLPFVINTRSSLNYQIFALLLSLLLVAFVACLFSLPRSNSFSLRRQAPPYGTAGQPLHYALELHNVGQHQQTGLGLFENAFMEPSAVARAVLSPRAADRRPVHPFQLRWLRLWESEGETPLAEQAVERLEPGQTALLQPSIVPARRGILRFFSASLAVADPLGLFRALLTLDATDRVCILPKRYPVPHISLPEGRRHHRGGLHLAASIGDAREFAGLRDYRPGDPLRHIHWRSWAKCGKPIVKEFQDEFFVRHALALDTFPPASWRPDRADVAVFEEAVSVAASFVAMDQPGEGLLDLLFVGATTHLLTTGRGLGRNDALLEALAVAQPCPDKPFSTLARSVLARAGLLSGCICVLLDWDAERQALVSGLRSLGVTPLTLVLRRDNAPDLDPGPLSDRPECFRVLTPATAARELASL